MGTAGTARERRAPAQSPFLGGETMGVGAKVKSLFKSKEGEGATQKVATVDVEMLTEIIHRGRMRNLRSYEIANAIVEYLKKKR